MRERHFLFHGELSDAPGRSESWNEYVEYRGDNRWLLIVEGSSFDGTKAAAPIRERLSTAGLLRWVIDRDAEDASAATGPEDDADQGRHFGERAASLREIAERVGAVHCARLLDRWKAGRWPSVPVIRVRAVRGKTTRTVWRGVHHRGFDVETNQGPAFMSLPDERGVASVVLKGEPSMSLGRPVRLSARIAKQVRYLLAPRDVSMSELLDALFREQAEAIPHQFGRKS